MGTTKQIVTQSVTPDEALEPNATFAERWLSREGESSPCAKWYKVSPAVRQTSQTTSAAPVTSSGGDNVEQCEDNIDNDSNGFTDFPADTGCSSASDNDESSVAAQCADGIDNDGDDLTDLDDTGCTDASDNDETGDNGMGFGRGDVVIGGACATDADCVHPNICSPLAGCQPI